MLLQRKNGTINLFQHVTGEYHCVTYGFTGTKMKGNVTCDDNKEKEMIICQLLWKTSEQKECLLDTLKIQNAIFVIAQNEIKFIREGSQVVLSKNSQNLLVVILHTVMRMQKMYLQICWNHLKKTLWKW